MSRNALDILKERGFFNQCTDEEALREHLDQPRTIYCGFDPTASSMQLGNLVPTFALAHLQRAGHKVIVLMGGATGMIGDPSGKSTERQFLSEEALRSNLETMKQGFSKFIDFDGSMGYTPAMMVDNYDWTSKISVIDWLRGIGKQFTVNYMMAKESVRARLEDRDQGISYTEFSYMMVQANDYAHLYDEYGCRVQVGGGDQWGNIVSGVDLIRRRGGEPCYGLTFPLVTTATGQKLGKSEGGTIYLDTDKTSVWEFYQYLVRVDDRDAIPFLKYFTFLPMEEIEELAQRHEADPGARVAHKRLAYELTTLVHGKAQADRMAQGAEALYAGRLDQLDADLIRQVFAGGPVAEVARQSLDAGIPLVELAADSGLVKSRGEAKRMLQQGAIYVNDKRAEGERIVTSEDILPSGVIVLRKGKKDYLLVQVQ